MTISFTVQGEPKPQPRPRAFARNMGGGKFAARVYDARTAEGWKSCVALAAKPYLPPVPHEGAVSVTLHFQMPRPKGHWLKSGYMSKSAPTFPLNRNDCDNLGKAVLDCLTQIGMWRDDGQVVDLNIRKRYATTPRDNGALVEIELL